MNKFLKISVIMLFVIALLITGGILMSKDKKPLHEQIAEYMFNSRALPKLEYCVEKYGEEFVLTELEKHVLNDDAIPALSKELNKKLQDKNNSNEEMLDSLRNKLTKVNKEIENILNAIMNGIVNSMLKEKLDELEQVKLNLDLKINELSIERTYGEEVLITEEQIRNMFGRFKEFVLTRNLPECKKFIGDYVKEVLVYKDHVEVIFNVVFSFVDNEISHDLRILKERKLNYYNLSKGVS